MAGFQGPIERVPTAQGYQLGIVMIAGFMLLLPLLYFGLIALVAAGIGLTLMRGAGNPVVFILSLLAAALLLVLLVFMLKPLFARRAGGRRIRSLIPDSDPLLFEFVRRICILVQAPPPARIDIDCDVNASAGFDGGFRGLLSNDLVLTIGLPLAAGLSLQQVGGVLAHEFGHFSQGAGMRLTFVVRSINHWFLRAVYERDRWDDWLTYLSQTLDPRIGWIFLLARLLVWITRKKLWCLMYVGNLVAGYMLRQMEYDADKYEARLAGSQTFSTTCRALRLLGVAWAESENDLGIYFREGRLVDNLPRLMMVNVRQIKPELQRKIDELIAQTETSIFDSHPADKDRLQAACAENAAGVFHSRLPASVLLRDFDAAARAVTWDYYHDIFGEKLQPTMLHPVQDLLARQEQDNLVFAAQKRFFLNAFTLLRPLRMRAYQFQPPESPHVYFEQLAAARQALPQRYPAYKPAYDHYDRADTFIMQAQQARSLLISQVRPSGAAFEFQFTTVHDAENRIHQATLEQSRLAAYLEPFEDAAAIRLHAALTLLHAPQVAAQMPGAAQMQQELLAVTPIVAAVNANLMSILEMRNGNAQLEVSCSHLNGHEENQYFVQEIVECLGRVYRHLWQLRGIFDAHYYPFDHAEGRMTVGNYLLRKIPEREALGDVLESSSGFLSRLASLYGRSLGRLCYFAEQVEMHLKFPPLPQPVDPAPPPNA